MLKVRDAEMLSGGEAECRCSTMKRQRDGEITYLGEN